jgi:putative aminopeptidase FrvX
MKNIDKKLLLPLLAVESESGDTDAMREHVGGVLSTMAGVTWDVDEWGNVIANKGAGAHPPCVVAHLDTVHDITGHGIVPIEHGGRITGLDPVTMQQTGIGGDDKCGIYAALFLLRELSNCRVILTVDEEIGAVGASKLDLCHLEGVGFLLQAERGHGNPRLW